MKIPLGVSLPHRSPDPIDVDTMRRVAQRADALGFQDLWVTENTIDHVFCFDALTILTYAAAVTTRIRVGVAVIVLPVHSPIEVAHRVATLDYVSHGRGWVASSTTASSRSQRSTASGGSGRASS